MERYSNIYFWVVVSIVLEALFFKAEGSVCVLKKRLNHEAGDTLQWSLPRSGLCWCATTIAHDIPDMKLQIEAETMQLCSMKQVNLTEFMWFTEDEVVDLTSTVNWNRQRLDVLLDRECEKVPPTVVNIPKNITKNTDLHSPSAMVNWTEPTATDNSGVPPVVTSSHKPGDEFAIGITDVVYTFIDPFGNNATIEFYVTVIDAESPIILDTILNATQVIPNISAPMAVMSWQEPLASDNSGFVTLTPNEYPGEAFTINGTLALVKQITYTAMDPSGNTYIQAFNITIQEFCRDPLGMEDGRITDEQITASTEHIVSLGLYHGVLNSRLNYQPTATTTGGWSVARPQASRTDQWIQADLGINKWVTGVLTQGRAEPTNTHFQYVTSFKVQYGLHGSSNVQVVMTEDNSEEMVFTGNSDTTTIVRALFPTPIFAGFVRINPQTFNQHPSLRFEVVGCDDGPV